MSPEAILLSIRDRSGEGSYRFSCPQCLDTVEKPADRKVAALLLSAGVELAEEGSRGRQTELFDGEPVADNGYPEVRPAGPPLTVDDLINFHFLLKDDEGFHRALHGS